MKKLTLQAAAVSLMLAGSASAADLRAPARAPLAPAPVAVAYNWTGCFVGAGAGYGVYDQETRYVEPGFSSLQNDNGGRGWFGTVQVGCDFQFGSNIVIGAFADYDWASIKGDMAVPSEGWVGQEKLKNSWTAGGRIGWIPWTTTQLLVYVSAGYSQAQFGQVNFLFADGGSSAGVALAKHTYSGWFLGSGYEYGFALVPGLFWKTEYRFYDYSSDTLPLISTGSTAPLGSLDNRKFVQTVRSELVWRFNFGNWGAPVVARY